MKAVFLQPRSSWSLALRSDTLWALLMVAIRHVWGEQRAQQVADAALDGEPPMVVSSAMEYVLPDADRHTSNGNHQSRQQRLLLLPTPLVPPVGEPARTLEEEERLKSHRTQSVLSLEQWSRRIRGETVEPEPIEHVTHFATADTIHVAIDRLRMDILQRRDTSELRRGRRFVLTETFARDAGLWFLVEGDMALVEPALRYLEHVGFGTDSSVGKGHFAVTIEDFEPPHVDEPTHMVTLSLYRPTPDELAWYRQHPTRLWYEVEFRRGKRSPQFGPVVSFDKRSVACFREGSVLPFRQQRFWGRATVVADAGDHKVLHAGFALMIPARLGEIA